MVFKAAIFALVVGFASGATTMCGKWAKDNKTECEYGVYEELKCVTTGNVYDKCSAKYCCNPPGATDCQTFYKGKKPDCKYGLYTDRRCIVDGPGHDKCEENHCCKYFPDQKCEMYVKDKKIACKNGVATKMCAPNGYGASTCTEAYCCVDAKPSANSTNCGSWAKDKDVKCTKVDEKKACDVKGTYDLVKCSEQFCCIPDYLLKTCNDYPPNVKPTEKNYEWRCDCYVAAMKMKCPPTMHAAMIPCSKYLNKSKDMNKCSLKACCVLH